jgi:hypothetical protein
MIDQEDMERDLDLPSKEDLVEHCGWAQRGLTAFLGARGASDEMVSDITDLIADLLHLADRNELDVDMIMRQARGHFDTERFEDTK